MQVEGSFAPAGLGGVRIKSPRLAPGATVYRSLRELCLERNAVG